MVVDLAAFIAMQYSLGAAIGNRRLAFLNDFHFPDFAVPRSPDRDRVICGWLDETAGAVPRVAFAGDVRDHFSHARDRRHQLPARAGTARRGDGRLLAEHARGEFPGCEMAAVSRAAASGRASVRVLCVWRHLATDR